VIFTTGGYVAIPVLLAAAVLRIPTLMWEGNRVPGRSVRFTARLASALAVSFAETCHQLPGRCFVTGTPIRSFEGLTQAEARTALGLDPELPCLLVFGGSQAVRRLNDAVGQALPDLVGGTSVIHVCGEAGLEEAQRNRNALPVELRGRYRPHAFLDAEMASALVAADLIVGRAGSSTLAEASALGTPIVVVPYPHASGRRAGSARRGLRRRRAAPSRRPGRRPSRPGADADSCPRPGPAGGGGRTDRAGPGPRRATGAAQLQRGRRAVAGRRVTAVLDDAALVQLGTDIQRRIGVKTSRHEPLARFTTMRVGGPADLFAEIRNLFELRALVRFARQRQLPHFILGRGSDLVISDQGMRGLVIHNRAQAFRFEGPRLVADSGLPMAKAATLGRTEGLSGLEFGLAIPGTVGGAVWANAGAHSSDIRAVLAEASVMRADGSEQVMDADGLALSYRDSLLKHSPADTPEVVTWAAFELTPADPAVVGQRLDEIRRWRQAHQPLGQPSAGSVFRNPADGPSAGALIDQLGMKGLRIGGAVVSEKHANFIVNDQGGTAADVRRLAEQVRAAVLRERGVELQLEIVFAGDWSGWGEEQ
jgi:UDP-N-acetylmuramate dehydrogenase